MSWGGTNEPAAQATLMSIGALGVDANKKHSKALFDIVNKELGIPQDRLVLILFSIFFKLYSFFFNFRLYISFVNAPSSDVGYTGTTFHDIFGG